MAKDHFNMSHANMLEYLGFEKQDLGILKDYAEQFYFSWGDTYAVDEDGCVWVKVGEVDPGDFFALAKQVPTWESPLANEAFLGQYA